MNCKLPNFKLALLLIISAALPGLAQRSFTQWSPVDGVSIRQGWHIEWYRGGEARIEGDLIGEVAFVWSDTRDGDRGVSMQVIDVDGNLKYNPESGLQVADSTGRQEDPGVWPDTDGGWFVAWEDFDMWVIDDEGNTEGDSLGDIYCTKIDADGNRIWGENERGVPVCVFPGIQEDVRIVHDGEGGCIIAWRDLRGGDFGDIYAMHILANGQPDPEWPENGMAIVAVAGAQTSHTADVDGAGGMIIGWKDGRHIGNEDIWAQRITPEGELLWGNRQGIPVCDHPDSNQEFPKLCPDGAGGAFFTWVDDRSDDTDKDIYAQRVDEDGRLMWGRSDEGVPVCTELWEQAGNRVIVSGAGNAIVLWQDKRHNRQEFDIYAMRITGVNNMQKLWEPDQGIPVSIAPRNQQEARLYTDGQEGAYVVWEDERDGGFPEIDIWAQRIHSNGNPAWAENGIPVCRVPLNQNSPLVRLTADGGCVVAWADARTGSNYIYAQRLTPDGEPVWEENGIPLVGGISGNATLPHVLSHGNNIFSLTWLDGRFGGLGTYPFLQYCRNDGDEVEVFGIQEGEPAGFPVMVVDTTTIGGGIAPKAVIDGEGGTIFVWEDHRRGQRHSIYAQRIGPPPQNQKLWGASGVKVADFAYDQNLPYVCSDGAGGAIVAWQGLTEDITYDIFVQRIDAQGNRNWGDVGIRITYQEGLDRVDESVEEIVSDGEGGAVVVWLAATWDTDDDLWAVRVDGDGNVLWRDEEINGIVICNEEEKQRNSRLVRHPGGFAVVWVDGRDVEGDIPQNDIYGQFLLPETGQKYWRNTGQLICGFEFHQENPDVAIDSEANIWVVWEDHRHSGGPFARELFLQKIDTTLQQNGRPTDLFERDGMRICQAARDQIEPRIIHDGRNGMFLLWEDYRTGVWSDIYAKHIRPNGAPYSMEWNENGNMVCGAFHKQNVPQIALLTDNGNQGAVIVWEDKRATGKEELSDTYIQRITDDWGSVPDARPNIPTGYDLEAVYPNPFNSQALVRFVTPRDGKVRLAIYDVTGRMVTEIANEYWSAGRHLIFIDGSSLSAGTYFIRLEANDIKVERSVSLIK